MQRPLFFVIAISLSACSSTSNIPSSGTQFDLDGCSPFLNCVSSESKVGLYQIEPIRLTEQLTPASWNKIRAAALELPGASLNKERYGYLDITCYSELFGFPDYLEILVGDDNQSLDVRSQSLIGLYDLGVNQGRVEQLRARLSDLGIASG